MKKLKVLLTNAPKFSLKEFSKKTNLIRSYTLYPPIQLATIAGATMKKVEDVEIEILDIEYEIMKYFKENEKSKYSADEYMKKILNAKLDSYKPDLVGITVVFSPSHTNTFIIANLVKEKNSNIKVVCGGNHATFAYKRMLNECSNLDFVFLYEGDNTFPLFINYLNGKIKFEELRGIAWLDKDSNEPKLSPYAPMIEDLDKLPIPSWDKIPLKEYQKYGRMGNIQRYGNEDLPSYVMQTVRGCVASCTFCSVRNFYGKGVRSLSADRVLKEIDHLYNDLGITQLEIMDDDFTYDKKRTLEICNGLAKRNYDLQWNLKNGVRLGTLNDEVVGALVSAKCRLISIGAESGNDSTLAIVRKPLSVKMLFEKSQIFHKHPDLYVVGNWIVGFPWEDWNDILNTFKVCKEVSFDWNNMFKFQPLAGTPEFNKLDQKSQETFDFDALEYNPVLRHHKEDKYLNELKNTDKTVSGEDELARKISELVYLKNLEINMLDNKNLHGKKIDSWVETKNGKLHYNHKVPQNLDRAIKDFEMIVGSIKRDHAVAYYSLAKAYRYKGEEKLVQKNLNKVQEILTDPRNIDWINYFNKLVPQNELAGLKYWPQVKEKFQDKLSL